VYQLCTAVQIGDAHGCCSHFGQVTFSAASSGFQATLPTKLIWLDGSAQIHLYNTIIWYQ